MMMKATYHTRQPQWEWQSGLDIYRGDDFLGNTEHWEEEIERSRSYCRPRAIDETNFHDSTDCKWREVKAVPEGAKLIFQSRSSTYYQEGDTLYRVSDHWMYGVRSCNWLLRRGRKAAGEYMGEQLIGKAKFSDFKYKPNKLSLRFLRYREHAEKLMQAKGIL